MSVARSQFRKLTDNDFRLMHLPPVLQAARLEKIPPKAQRLVRSYINNLDRMFETGTGVVLHGEVGRGKTFAAAVLAKAVRAYKKSVYFSFFWKLRDDLLADAYLENDVPLGHWVRDVDFLVIDGIKLFDFARDEGLNGRTLSMRELSRLMEFRHFQKKPTVLVLQGTLGKKTDFGRTCETLAKEIGSFSYAILVEGVSQHADMTDGLENL